VQTNGDFGSAGYEEEDEAAEEGTKRGIRERLAQLSEEPLSAERLRLFGRSLQIRDARVGAQGGGEDRHHHDHAEEDPEIRVDLRVHLCILELRG
jgi:hypothetical protein